MPNAKSSVRRDKPLGWAWLKDFLGVLNAFDNPLPMESLDVTALGIEVPHRQPMLSIDHLIEPLLPLAGWQGRHAGYALSIYRWLLTTKAGLERISEGNPASIPLTQVTLQSNGQGRFRVTDQGFLNTLANRLIRELQRIEDWRLRICEGCGHLFIAPRRKSIICSPECHNRWRQRNWYRQEKERDELVAKLLAENKDARGIAELARIIAERLSTSRSKVSVSKARAYIARVQRRENGSS